MQEPLEIILFNESNEGETDDQELEEGEPFPAYSSESSIQSWITWFCSIQGHDYYLEVPEEFIEDEFNLTGLSTIVPYYTQAMETILDFESDYDNNQAQQHEEDQEEEENECIGEEPLFREIEDEDFWNEEDKTPKYERLKNPKMIEPYAFMLYGLIHQRYLLTKNGLRIMAQRYSNGQFGTCPRYYCRQSSVLPVGAYDETSRESVHLYCPKCLDMYCPPSSIYQCVDGAHFGSTYCHLLFLNYPELVPNPNSRLYQPSIFGFKINSRSQTAPKNQWLRQRPLEYTADEGSDENIEEDAVEVDEMFSLPHLDNIVYRFHDFHI